MNPHSDDNTDLQRREQEIRDREISLRMRELEIELHKTPVHQTVKHNPPESFFQRWKRKVVQVATFVGIVLAVVVTLKIAAWLTTVVIIGAIAWVVYQIVKGRSTP